MKKRLPYIYRSFALLFFAYTFISFSDSPPTGRTGAPGESNCSGCHFGGTQTGSVDIQGINDNPVVPNKTYNVSIVINLTSGSSSRAGFQFVALDGNTAGSASTGSFSNLGTNVGTATSGSRTYTQHSGDENAYLGSMVTYTFDWTAPSTSTNNISFYTAANIADGNFASGDLIVFDSDLNIPLPVELQSFKANARNNNEVEIVWTTSTERNSQYFEVLRSEDGIDYEIIGKIEAAGYADEMQSYQFIDDRPIFNKNSFYRLKQYDYDNRFAYSSIETIQVMNFQNDHLNIFPNPATRSSCLFIDYLSDQALPNAQVRIYDQSGKLVVDQMQEDSGIAEGFNKFVIDIPTLSVGTYFLTITGGNGEILNTRSFVVGD